MATNEFKPRSDSSRNRAGEAPDLHTVIEKERHRLMTAEALMHCVAVAMDDNDCAADTPDYQTLIDLSRHLIKQTIDQLDSVRMKPLLEKIGVHGTDAVKESTVTYVH